MIWWDDLSQTLKLQVIRRIVSADTFDGDDIIEGTLQSEDQPEKRVSQVWTYYNQISPLVNLDQLENFASSVQTIDATSESNFGIPAIKKIFSRWIPTGGSATAQRVNDLIIARYKIPPRRFSFDIASTHGPSKPELAGGYYLAGWPFQDDTGAETLIPIQITRSALKSERYNLEAEEMLATDITLGNSPDSPHLINFDASYNNVNLRTIHDTLYPAPISGTVVHCIVAVGVIIGSDNTGSPSFDVGSWPAGVTVTLELNGRIEGAGGVGGRSGLAFLAASPGGGGGIALYTRYAIGVIYGAGAQVWGGGGGGGGGGGSFVSAGGTGGAISGGGGGGGAGRNAGSGGAAQDTSTGSAGTAGTDTAGGSGGTSVWTGVGGAGGTPGVNGAVGVPGNVEIGGTGGTAGAAIDGVSFRTVLSGSADIKGSQIN